MTRLKTSLNLWAAISVVIGTIIGSGIFMKPATMAGLLGSPELLIAVWIGAGIITLFGALSNAEVASMLPETGGQYVFFQKMYGPFFAFLYGWSAFAVFNTAGTASVAYVLSTYAGYFISLPELSDSTVASFDVFIPGIGHIFPLNQIGLKGLTVLILLGLTWINYRSTEWGGRVLVILTFLKLVAIGLVVLMIFGSGKGDIAHFSMDSVHGMKKGWAMVAAILAATSGAFWAYDGWNNITFVAGEIDTPQRNIPKSLIVGVITCIIVYVIVNLAYLYVMPVDQIAGSPLVASDAASVVLGGLGGGLIAMLVILSTLGGTHSNVLSTSRVTFSMATSGYFFRKIGEVHPRFGTPAKALWVHGIWASLLVFSGSFDTLTDMVIFVSWIFYGMTGLGVFVLRYKMPDHQRPYRVWGYPVVPAVFVLFTLVYLSMTLYADIQLYLEGKTFFIQSVMGLVLTLLGVPVYFYLRRNQSSSLSS